MATPVSPRNGAERAARWVIGFAVVVLAGTATFALSPGVRGLAGAPASPPPGYAPGDVFEDGRLATTGDAGSLVLVAAPNCGAASLSHDFFVSIVAEAQRAGLVVWLQSPDVRSDYRETYASSLGIDRAHVVPWSQSSSRLRTMPAIILLGADGRVSHFWSQAPDSNTQREIRQRLAELSSTE